MSPEIWRAVMTETDMDIDLSGLVSAEMIQRWQRERDRLTKMIERLAKKRDGLEKMVLLGTELTKTNATTGPTEPSMPLVARARRGGTWKGIISDILAREVRGLTHAELKAEIAKTQLAERLEQSEKGFYGAVARLVADREAIRHKGRTYSPATFEKFQKDVAAGVAADKEAPPASQRSPVKDAILRFLSARPTGAKAGEILRHVQKLPEYGSNTAVYNLISRMRKRQEIIKRGKLYRLPPNTDEAPPDPKSNGASPIAGGAATPPIESRDSLG